MFCKLMSSLLIAGALAFRQDNSIEGVTHGFTLPPLPYAYNGLEPYIDTMTMILHHDKHHQSYVTNLNTALESAGRLVKNYQGALTDLVVAVGSGKLPDSIETSIRNNGGGHWNHSFFWKLMAPVQENTGSRRLKSRLRGQAEDEEEEEQKGCAAVDAIKEEFGSMEKFEEAFAAAASGVFGSGWAWLCVSSKDVSLQITTTPNQDNPLMSIYNEGLVPILGIDVWEHAYYLKHQNMRTDFISAFLDVVNWPQVEANYIVAAQGGIPDPLELTVLTSGC